MVYGLKRLGRIDRKNRKKESRIDRQKEENDVTLEIKRDKDKEIKIKKEIK